MDQLQPTHSTALDKTNKLNNACSFKKQIKQVLLTQISNIMVVRKCVGILEAINVCKYLKMLVFTPLKGANT